MANETLEVRSCFVPERTIEGTQPLKEGAVGSLLVYRPRNTSVELEVESYTSMRYHGQ